MVEEATIVMDGVKVVLRVSKYDSGEIVVQREIYNLDITNYTPSETMDYVGGRPIHRGIENE